ncbi:NfeD family protein [Brevibacillus sp. B_LB10_24]|uniref:NfeD family protein n=1 Tax=Brevibacillus sp. B_LB10_24 TaxID=3380645 RepID=UPI0038B6BCF4
MAWPEILFLVCVGIGLIYACINLLFGDTTSHVPHFEVPLLQPLSLMSGLTSFGGCGYLLYRWTALSLPSVFLGAAAAGIAITVISYFIWVKPMKDAEVSTGYSLQQLTGKIGEVLTAIPENGLGEVVIPMITGTTNHMAASMDQVSIPEGTRVVVVEVKDHVLYVVPFQ